MMPQSHPKQASGDPTDPVSYELHLRAEDATECDVCAVRMQRINYHCAVRPREARTPQSMLICDRCVDNLLARQRPDGQGFGGGGIH